MIDPKLPSDERIERAQSLFDESRIFWQPMHSEMFNAQVFHHNTDNEGQWDSADLKKLRDNKRAALTFNVTANKIYQVTGVNEEHHMRPIAHPIGIEDRSLSDFLSALLGTVSRNLDIELFDAEIFENSLIEGEHSLNLDVDSDPDRPSWVRFRATVVPGTDVAWDISSTMRDRSDARYVFWWKWVNKDEFLLEWPEMEDEVNNLFDVEGNTLPYAEESTFATSRGNFLGVDRDDYSAYSGMVNRTSKELRVVHCEYKVPVKRHYAILRDGRATPIEPKMASALKARRTAQPGMVERVVEVWSEEWYWMEFTKGMELFHGVNPQPFVGLSLVPMLCYRDRTTGQAYGLIRHMMDPQKDINRAHSQSLDHLSAQAKPGWMAERSAVPDQGAFEDANARSGSVTIVEDGALSGSRIVERKVPLYSEAAAARLLQGRELHDMVSGIQMDPESPARAQEAATTVSLREKRSLRSLIQVLKNFQRYQKQVALKIIQGCLKAMPIDQMMQYVGQPQRWQVSPEGMITDTTRKVQIDIADIRTLYAHIELEPMEGDLQKSALLAVIGQFMTLGVQIDPELIYKLMAPSRAVEDQLLEFYHTTSAAQGQQAQQQQEFAAKQLATENAADAQKGEVEKERAKTERMRIMEEVRHDIKKEQNDFMLGLLGVLEKADSGEKKFLLDMKTQLEARMAKERTVNV